MLGTMPKNHCRLGQEFHCDTVVRARYVCRAAGTLAESRQRKSSCSSAASITKPAASSFGRWNCSHSRALLNSRTARAESVKSHLPVNVPPVPDLANQSRVSPTGYSVSGQRVIYVAPSAGTGHSTPLWLRLWMGCACAPYNLFIRAFAHRQYREVLSERRLHHERHLALRSRRRQRQ
jgi:hypothetical protein